MDAVTEPSKNGLAWPSSRVEWRDIKKLKPHPKNPRTHTPEQVDQLAESIAEFGLTKPILIDDKDTILAGHGTVLGAKKAGERRILCSIAEGWSEKKKLAYVIADNQHGLNSGWDGEILKAGLIWVGDEYRGLTGFSNQALDEMGVDLENAEVELTGSGANLAESLQRSALLKLVNITIAEPSNKVEAGDHYVLSKRHHLLCVTVITQWDRWKDLLAEGSMFCPYAGVFIPFSERAKKNNLVMVQPDTYIAGHILDRYIEVHGKKAVAKLDQ